MAYGQNGDNRQFSTLQTQTNWVTALFFAFLVLCVAALISDYFQAELLNRAIAGGAFTNAEAVANDARQTLIAWVQIVVNVIAGTVFLVWINRAYKNLYALRAEGVRFSSGWAVAWFFIPFASLFRPYQVMSEVWRASDPAANLSDSDSWKYLSLPRIVGLWWTFFLVSNWASQLAGRFILRADTASDLLTATYAYMGSEVVSIIGIVITVLLVQRVRRVQTEKYGKILQSNLAEPAIG